MALLRGDPLQDQLININQLVLSDINYRKEP